MRPPLDRQITNCEATLALVRDACLCLEANLDRRMTLAALGKCVGSSPYHLQRTFKRVVGLTPRQYVEAKRLALFKERLRSGGSVTSSVYEAGFGSTSRLYERADEHLGMTPTSYQAGGEGVTVGYSIADCPLGRVLVAATDKGVCYVGLADSDEDLVAHLYNELPGAYIAKDDRLLGEWLK